MEIEDYILEIDNEQDELQVDEPETDTDTEVADAENEIIQIATLDFDKIRLQNSDIYAWIEVPGTDVDYPVLCGKEDDYYLKRGLNKEYLLAGCIYSNLDNLLDFSDFVHVIYGHNMNDESMFGSLKRFYDKAFFEANDEIIIFTDDAVRKYRIVATRRHSDLYLYDEFDGYSETGRKSFISMISEKEDDISHVRDDEEFSAEDRFLVLSTCIKGEAEKRFLVVGKLIEELPARK